MAFETLKQTGQLEKNEVSNRGRSIPDGHVVGIYLTLIQQMQNENLIDANLMTLETVEVCALYWVNNLSDSSTVTEEEVMLGPWRGAMAQSGSGDV